MRLIIKAASITVSLIIFCAFVSFALSGCLHPIGPLPENLFATLSPADVSKIIDEAEENKTSDTIDESDSNSASGSNGASTTNGASAANEAPDAPDAPEISATSATPAASATTSPSPAPVPTQPLSTENIIPIENTIPTENTIPSENIIPDDPLPTEPLPTEPASSSPPVRYGSPYLGDGSLSDEPLSWYFIRNGDHTPPGAMRTFDIKQFGARYLGDTDKKIIFLTFDEGYENGHTGGILDTLALYGVRAAFFLTKPYIKANPELCARIVTEGHIAANHSVSHRSFPTLSDDEIELELTGCADYFEEVIGAPMCMFFRPPEGNYSARTLYTTHGLGYKTVFWSFAYEDWNVDRQPGAEAAYKNVMNGLHNGAVLLLHAVSSSNAEALPDIITSARELGYEFGSLYELE